MSFVQIVAAMENMSASIVMAKVILQMVSFVTRVLGLVLIGPVIIAEVPEMYGKKINPYITTAIY